MKNKMRAIAYYLPQFHPIPENDRWWGKGFTEWTNVAKARPLFRSHRQPLIPADLGFYDLRVSETRVAQAQLAREHGIEGFCYWHYWFGGGKRLLERPFTEVLRSGEPDFPFCLGWANESWSGIWHGSPNRVLMEQTYPGPVDEERHFHLVAEAFFDRRYLTIDGKPIFYVYKGPQLPEPQRFTEHWQELAIKAGLVGIYFIGEDDSLDINPWSPREHGFDAVVPNTPGVPIHGLNKKRFTQRWTVPALYHRLLKHPAIYTYRDFVEQGHIDPGHDDFYPNVLANWDNTPRSGRNGYILADSTPELFRGYLQRAVEQVSDRPPERRIVFIKSWNEWAEGNHLEPDLRFGHGYLEACREVLSG